MAIFDTWAKYIVGVLKAESDCAANLVGHPVLIGDAREFIIENVLKRILPPAYEIGRGQIIDSDDKKSRQLDIVIARSDSPALALPGGDKLYLLESVLATIEVKSHLDAETLTDALYNCASVADLNSCVHGPSKAEVLAKRHIRTKPDSTFYHKDYIEVMRLSSIGYPATYVFGFKGYKERYDDLLAAVSAWIDSRWRDDKDVHLRHLPAVISAEGCFAARNESPFAATPTDPAQKPAHYIVGNDETPLRMLVFHLLNTIFAKLPWGADIEGLKMEPRRYLAQMQSFKYDSGITFAEPENYHQGMAES